MVLVAVACGAPAAPPTTPVTDSRAPALVGAAPTEAAAPVPVATEGVQVKIENPLAEARGPETIAIKLSELQRILPTLDPARMVVLDAASRQVLSQLVDQNG